MAVIRDVRELDVYQRAYALANRVFEVSRRFPGNERFSLTDQVRRSSRSVCANMAEAWRKRRYPAMFVSKLTDADAEAGETTVWLDFAFDHGYATRDPAIFEEYDHLHAQLVKMIDHPEQWCSGLAQRRSGFTPDIAAPLRPSSPSPLHQ